MEERIGSQLKDRKPEEVCERFRCIVQVVNRGYNYDAATCSEACMSPHTGAPPRTGFCLAAVETSRVEIMAGHDTEMTA